MKFCRFFSKTILALSVLGAGIAHGAFRYESTLTAGGYTAAETLENFPLLVRVSAARIQGFDYSLCQADGKDIQFTSEDGKTVYPHEIDEWNTGDGAESLVWVRVPLSAGLKLKMKFGDTALSSAPAYSTNGSVWKDAGYACVYHLNETAGSGTTSYPAYDSSRYGLDAVAKKGGSGNAAQIASYDAGAIGRARALNTSAQWTGNALVGQDCSQMGLGTTFTVTGWFYVTQGNANQVICARRNATGDGNGWYFTIGNANQIYVYGASSSAIGYPVGMNFTSVPGGWFHLAVAYNGGQATVYFQGESKGTKNIPAAPTENGMAFSIGNVLALNTTALSGRQDEVRLRAGNPSAEWVKAEYESVMLADYVTAGAAAEQTVADTLTVTSSSEYQKGVVSPAYGVSTIAAGTVVCTAPEAPVVKSEGAEWRYTGWKLTQVSAAGEKTVTTGDGTTCSFVHAAGGSANLEWQHNLYFEVQTASTDALRGSVTGGGWLGEGSVGTLRLVPAAGSEFKGWASANVPLARKTDNPYTFLVTGPDVFAAEFCDLRYHWKADSAGALAGYWNSASHWTDVDGDGVGDIPPNDGTATVVLPATNTTYTITLSGSHKDVDIKGIYVLATPVFSGSSGNAITISSGSMTLREGGIEMDASRNPLGLKFACDVNIPVSQTWMNMCNALAPGNSVNNDALSFSKKLTVAEDAVVTVAGTTPFTVSANNAADFKGKIRTNCITQFGATSLLTRGTDGLFELYPEDEPYATQSGARLTADATASSSPIVITQPVKFDWKNTTKTMKVQLQVASGIAGNAWNSDWQGPISGTFGDKKLSFGNVMTSSSQHRSHHPEKQRNWFSGDNSGLDTTGLPSICFPHGVFTMAHANALGKDNVLGVSIGGGDTSGYFAGITATNNITVNSKVTLGAGSLAAMLGMLDAGTATFTGDFTGNQLSQVFLHAVPGATARFTGAFTMNNANNYSLEVTGGGMVELSGDNAAVNQKSLNARVGSTVLGHANAAGTKPINLGGVVPGEFTVRAVVDRTFSQAGTGWKDVKDIGPGSNTRTNYTYAVASLTTDGVELKVGDSFLYITDVADGSAGRIYTIVEQGRFVSEWLAYAPGFKVKVLEGAEYGGKTFMMAAGASASTATTCGTCTAVLDSPVLNPDAKVLAKNGVTIANAINVTDNKSTGVSAIGSADASSVTFSGDITLAKDVVFEAAAGSVVNVTGNIVNEGGFNVGFAGLGTVKFANGLDVAGKTIAVRLSADQVPTEGLFRYELAQGLVGKAAGVTVTTADGSTVPASWTARQSGSKLVFRNRAAGFAILIR